MKRTDKKGFTIVELVIVIAVIAILAAVLIPNISKLVQKANTSADESLVRNLNTALSMDVEKHTTMSEALKAAKDNGGYDLETIELKGKGNKILWDSVNDCFVYLKGTDRVYLPNTQSVKKASEMKDYEYFEILETMPEDMSKQKYSIYLAGENYDKAVTVTVGFDAGENTGIPAVTYQRNANAIAQDVIVRTNGGNFTVEAKTDVVRHYGAANKTEIKAVAPDSSHENGVSVYVSIEDGHFYAEKDAKVFNLTVKKDGVKITVDSAAKVVAYSKDGSVTTITVNGTKLAESEIKTVPSGDIAEVVADNGVAEIDGVQFATLQAAFDAAYDGATIVLKKDILLDLPATLVNSVSVTLDANGKTISNTTDIWDESKMNWSLISVRAGKLTITGNGNFIAKKNDCFTFDIQNGGECILENGTFVGNISVVYVYCGALTVNGGSFSVQQKNSAHADGYVLNCYDESYKNQTATIVVTGGSFEKFNPTDCWAEGEHTNFVKEGYVVESYTPDNADGVIIYTVKSN